MLGLVSSFDSVCTGSCQGCAGQDEDGGEWGKVKCQLLPCQMFSHLNHLTVERHHCVFACFPVWSSWSRWEGNELAEQDTVESGDSAETLLCHLSLQTSVLHPPSSMQTAWAKRFCQSINDHCQLGRAAVICNKSRNFKIFSFAKKKYALNKKNTTQSCFWSMAWQIYLHSTCFFFISCLSLERDLKYFVKRLKDLH